MIIKTMHFGEVEVDEKSIIHFEEGIPGFDDIKSYVVLSDGNKDTPFRWLQAVEQPHPAFAIISPFEVNKDYEVEIDKATEEALEIKDSSEVVIYSIVVIPEDISKMTANLKAPIIINTANNKGKQMIMDNSLYDIRHYILDELLKVNEVQRQEGK